MYPGEVVKIKEHKKIPEALRGQQGTVELVFDRGKQLHILSEGKVILATPEDIYENKDIKNKIIEKLYNLYLKNCLDISSIEGYEKLKGKTTSKYMEWGEVLPILQILENTDIIEAFEISIYKYLEKS